MESKVIASSSLDLFFKNSALDCFGSYHSESDLRKANDFPAHFSANSARCWSSLCFPPSTMAASSVATSSLFSHVEDEKCAMENFSIQSSIVSFASIVSSLATEVGINNGNPMSSFSSCVDTIEDARVSYPE